MFNLLSITFFAMEACILWLLAGSLSESSSDSLRNSLNFLVYMHATPTPEYIQQAELADSWDIDRVTINVSLLTGTFPITEK